jgi:sulfide:quinone oxidoreductase
MAIDAATRRVTTDARSYDPDFLVVALGADYDLDATPGLREGGLEFYTLAGAERLHEALGAFDGGRVILSVLGQPFKCPPAPFEGAFLLHEHFTKAGIRESVQMTMTFPMQRPVPVTPAVSQMFRDGLADRGIEERPQQVVTSIDPAKKEAHLASGETLPYDLFRRHPRPPRRRSAPGLRSGGRRLGARQPVQPQDAPLRRLRDRRRLHRPSHRPEGRHLLGGCRARRGR